MPMRHQHDSSPAARGASGFTLIELLVTVTVVAVLASIVLATLAKVRATSRSFVCKNNLKTIAFEFIHFADNVNHSYRGDSERFGRRGFYLEDFQERLYRVDEFWDRPAPGEVALDASKEVMMCPAGPRELKRTSGLPCSQGAVVPAANVTVGFNMRLHRASENVDGLWIWRQVRLTHRVLEHATVPLAFDVDGDTAAQRRLRPYYSAPPEGQPGPYGTGDFWFPEPRHGNRANVAFVGGHVLSSPAAEQQGGWDWAYQHPPQ